MIFFSVNLSLSLSRSLSLIETSPLILSNFSFFNPSLNLKFGKRERLKKLSYLLDVIILSSNSSSLSFFSHPFNLHYNLCWFLRFRHFVLWFIHPLMFGWNYRSNIFIICSSDINFSITLHSECLALRAWFYARSIHPSFLSFSLFLSKKLTLWFPSPLEASKVVPFFFDWVCCVKRQGERKERKKRKSRMMAMIQFGWVFDSRHTLDTFFTWCFLPFSSFHIFLLPPPLLSSLSSNLKIFPSLLVL